MTTLAATLERSGFAQRFRFAQNGTTFRRDSMAGLTTFIVMSYIIFLNPLILTSVPGLEFDAVLTSTCIVAGALTIIMGLYTNRAFALAPGLGLNATVAFTLVAGEGLGFPEAMGIVLLEGALITGLVLLGWREAVMEAIPLELKKAIAIGIGLFIAFIGLDASGLLVRAETGAGPPVALVDFTSWEVAVVIFGIIVTVAMRAMGIRGDLLIGIILTTAFASLINYTTATGAYPRETGWGWWPDDVLQGPDFSLMGDVSLDAFTAAKLGVIGALAFVFTLFLADFFDTMGTLVGVGKQAGYLDEQGRLPQVRKPLLVDSIAAMAGGAASASSATTYIESSAGVGVGGRTGWVSVVTGVLFFPFLFFAPLIGMVPRAATAPALLIVGWLMMTALSEAEEEATPHGSPEDKRRILAGINFGDVAIGLSAAVTIMLMPFSFSITDGIAAGFIIFVVIRLAQRRWRDVHPLMYLAAGLFTLFFLVPLLQDNFDWI
jgi:AGZA family xanthine/uracil permease-like MFS transporter